MWPHMSGNGREKEVKEKISRQGVINDPLSQTHSSANSEHYFHLNFFVLGNLKICDGRTDGRHL